ARARARARRTDERGAREAVALAGLAPPPPEGGDRDLLPRLEVAGAVRGRAALGRRARPPDRRDRPLRADARGGGRPRPQLLLPPVPEEAAEAPRVPRERPAERLARHEAGVASARVLRGVGEPAAPDPDGARPTREAVDLARGVQPQGVRGRHG